MAHTTFIGGKKILLEASWLVLENEDVTVTFKDSDGDDVTVKIEIKSTSENNDSEDIKKPSIQIEEVDDIPVIRFKNWNGGFGKSTGKPIAFASTSDGKIELSFLASIAKLSKLYRIEFQVMSEEKK
ncbi:hypothetical protein O3299_00580 [Janthinobacterium sp. SUN176]|uniref:DUF6864 domain-containing function n=1 Tax=Janthinobacterium sp. SUN176 TaxID=3014788 RepID=UPI0027122E8D|nr:hypothetical protein [Janthinobacterium sp. SUN176]MDO8070006.1 hypothetical protein [Janthinobacterium sp. SUN176]